MSSQIWSPKLKTIVLHGQGYHAPQCVWGRTNIEQWSSDNSVAKHLISSQWQRSQVLYNTYDSWGVSLLVTRMWFQRGAGICLFGIETRLVLEPTWPPILRMKQPEPEADHSLLSPTAFLNIPQSVHPLSQSENSCTHFQWKSNFQLRQLLSCVTNTRYIDFLKNVFFCNVPNQSTVMMFASRGWGKLEKTSVKTGMSLNAYQNMYPNIPEQ